MQTPTSARYHVLLIGIDGYARDPLAGSVNDVDDLAELLGKDPFCVPASSIRKLVAPAQGARRTASPDETPPTLQAIVKELQALAGPSVQPGDRVLVYYSGHGSYERMPKGAAYFEGLVPLDHDASGLLYDVELNPLLQAIANACQDLTVVLDCCHSAGATRDSMPSLHGARVRFMQPAPRRDASPSPGAARIEEKKLRPETRPAVEKYTVIAACHANERAAECQLPAGSDRSHGVLSHCLLELLQGTDPQTLATLRWNDVWEQLKAAVVSLNPAQCPQILGPRERRLFGGPWQPQDLGYRLDKNADGTYTVGAGSLAGLSKGAEIAVYGPTPPRFPVLESTEDLQARRGVLIIDYVELASSIAVVKDAAATIDVADGARGRLKRLGTPDRLRVAVDGNVDPAVREALLTHASRDRFVVLPENDLRQEARVGQFANQDLWIGDDLYAPEDPTSPGPLARISRKSENGAADLASALRAGLNHYAQYVIPLRIFRGGGFTLPEGSIAVRIFDCNGLKTPADLETDIGLRREAEKDGRGRYRLKNGDRVAIHVVNLRPSTDLFLSLLLCSLEGQIQLLDSDVLIKPRSGKLFWSEGETGVPFTMICPPERGWGVDRLVVIATDERGIDLGVLDQAQTLDEAMKAAMGTKGCEPQSTKSPGGTRFTAAQISIKVGEDH